MITLVVSLTLYIGLLGWLFEVVDGVCELQRLLDC